jgi:hypothetical protein
MEGGIGGVGKIAGTVRGRKETLQCFVSIMAAFALRKSKPKLGCVNFAWRNEWENCILLKWTVCETKFHEGMGLLLALTIVGPEAGDVEEKGMRLRAAPVSTR